MTTSAFDRGAQELLAQSPARITWRTAEGDFVFSNGAAGGASRFGGWTPDDEPFEDRESSVGTGDEEAFVYRRDYTARFEVREVPAWALGVFLALKRHLKANGIVTVHTADGAARTYVCKLKPKSTPTATQSNGAEMLYTCAIELRNTAAADMLCDY